MGAIKVIMSSTFIPGNKNEALHVRIIELGNETIHTDVCCTCQLKGWIYHTLRDVVTSIQNTTVWQAMEAHLLLSCPTNLSGKTRKIQSKDPHETVLHSTWPVGLDVNEPLPVAPLFAPNISIVQLFTVLSPGLLVMSTFSRQTGPQIPSECVDRRENRHIATRDLTAATFVRATA